ncbi:MAG: PTS sugar transporter subunit IIB [Faecalibacillus intestinalis]|uniref:PTS sugar transporter subunit IIB n=1 Tax=Faecalibacillus intestinalis TaxID=1982626 RepID=UPI0039996A13
MKQNNDNCKNSDDALKIAESVKGIESCNIGGMRNIGQEDGKMITAQICFTPKDIENVKKIQDFESKLILERSSRHKKKI